MIKHNYLWKSINYFNLHKRIDVNQMKTKNTTSVRTNNHGYVPLVVSIILSFPLLLLITWFSFRITRSVQLVKQELHNFNLLCSILSTIVCLFALFLFAIVLYIIVRLMASDYHFGIFKRFVYAWCNADLHSPLVYQDQIWYQQNMYNKSVSRYTKLHTQSHVKEWDCIITLYQ